MSTHNISFCGEIRKICGYPLLSVAMIQVALLTLHHKVSSSNPARGGLISCCLALPVTDPTIKAP